MQLSLLVLALGVSMSYAMVCPPDICTRVRCAGIRAEDCAGRVDANGGFCGCCPACIQQAAEGELCMSSLILLGAPQNTECAEGLFCNRNTAKCQKKPCSVKLQEFHTLQDTAKKAGHHLLGQSPPRCESDGTYSAVQCSGSVCYCSNKEGEQLFRDKPNNLLYQANIWEQNNMNCRCAVEQHEYMKTGLIGRLFRCENNGNYAKVGCTGSVCYCADEHGKQVGTNTVNIGQQESLKC
ncbi:uncharacterized protein LOC135461473 [Liolophura sinensis]|uniref:uncharacterized protein LOC135461473 n=1 Tax=Liolophura sinensis TaxID=3198878 RepID=UPI003158F377